MGSVRAGFVDSLNSIADAAIPMSMAYIKVIKKKRKGEEIVFLPRINLCAWLLAAACGGGIGRKGGNAAGPAVAPVPLC